ncbi:MAG TPA: cysteine desulfurase family protein [Candidatus Paceibacterota bacterium]|jgi:cysteine desulfurase|nr:cysteine desulfurase family protein [Candidatus Paceibacterota bacterium]
MFKSRIYLDYASLTPIDPRVTREMKSYSSFAYTNPSSLYKEGVNAKKALAEGRQKVARYLNAHADEIIFTSGGTEANALALEGVGRAAVHAGFVDPMKGGKPHIIISSIEHSSIIETATMLEKHGCEVTRLSIDTNGIISLDELKKSIKENTVLISIMMVNNEIGSIQPIKEIAKIVRQKRKDGNIEKDNSTSIYPLLHTDAAQALYEEINMQNIGVDLLTLDGSKVYGPRGIGALYVRRNTPIEAIILGGGQESGLRSGTENLPSIMGFAKALEIIQIEKREKGKKENERVAKLRAYFIDEIKNIRPDIKVNGDSSNSAPHIVNISIPGIDNEFLLFKLDAKGVACSTKSSCLRDEEESYVLKSIGANSATSLRFSFGRWTTLGDIKRAIKIIRLAL